MDAYQPAIEAVLLAAQTILECGGEIYRAEETVVRMGQGLGFVKTEVMALPTGYFITFQLPSGDNRSYTRRIHERNLYLSDMNEVNTVSRLVARGELDGAEALRRLLAIRQKPRLSPALTTLLFALCCGCFTVMFAGSASDFGISFFCGLCVRLLTPLFVRLRCPAPLISMFSGLVTAGVAVLLLSVLGGDRQAVITGAMMPLLPGLTFTNAVRDTMRGDLVSGLARGAEALLNVLLLGYGVVFILSL